MTILFGNVQDDVGVETWEAFGGTTSTVVKRLITKAENRIKDITGTTVGYDVPIRSLADAYVYQRVKGGLGPESVERTPYTDLINKSLDDVKSSLKVKGYSIDGKHVMFQSVNQ